MELEDLEQEIVHLRRSALTEVETEPLSPESQLEFEKVLAYLDLARIHTLAAILAQTKAIADRKLGR